MTPRVLPARHRLARKAAKKGELLSSSDVDDTYRMPDGQVIVVMNSHVHKRLRNGKAGEAWR